MARMMTANGAIGVAELGAGGVPLVFLHGVGSDKSAWAPQLAHFGATRRTIALDYPGYGESDPIPATGHGAAHDALAQAVLATQGGSHMNTLIFRTAAPLIATAMVLFSLIVLLRGHNDPGGGFIGGLIAVSAVAIYGIAFGVPVARRALYFHPLAIAGAGLFLAASSGLLSLGHAVPFLTGIWTTVRLFGVVVDDFEE